MYTWYDRPGAAVTGYIADAVAGEAGVAATVAALVGAFNDLQAQVDGLSTAGITIDGFQVFATADAPLDADESWIGDIALGLDGAGSSFGTVWGLATTAPTKARVRLYIRGDQQVEDEPRDAATAPDPSVCCILDVTIDTGSGTTLVPVHVPYGFSSPSNTMVVTLTNTDSTAKTPSVQVRATAVLVG